MALIRIPSAPTPATTSSPGAMSAADKAKLDDAIIYVANNFDPTVAPGLAGRAGAEAVTVDKTKSWRHGVPVTDATTADTNWAEVGSLS